jgi:hypothetical protein
MRLVATFYQGNSSCVSLTSQIKSSVLLSTPYCKKKVKRKRKREREREEEEEEGK